MLGSYSLVETDMEVLQTMTPDDQAFEQLGRWVLNEFRECCADVDGGSIQDKAEELGLLVRVQVTEPCGENCSCAEYGDFPQECLRLKEGVPR